MAASGGARSQLQLHYDGVGDYFSTEFVELGNKHELGLGWLRAEAQDYSYSYNCNKMELESKFQRNAKT